MDHSSTPNSFHFFSRLPVELRLRIWSFNLPRTRLVPITCGVSPSVSSPPSCLLSGCVSPATIPANLHVCAESRIEALKKYGLYFGFVRGPGQVVFDPSSDLLYFGPRQGYMADDAQFHTFMAMCEPDELARVQRIAINDSLFWIGPEYRSMAAGYMTVALIEQLCLRMTGLTDIVFIPRDQDLACHPAETVQRMSHQIESSMATVCRKNPSWVPPTWRILPMIAFHGQNF